MSIGPASALYSCGGNVPVLWNPIMPDADSVASHEMNCTFVPLAHYDWSLQPALVAVAIPWNPTAYCLISSFCAVSLWMTIELTFQVFFTFRRHRGLYFWSLLVCTWGVTLHVLGLILKLFNESNWIVSSIIFKIGWVGNVTGFSLVLYSRLNLVVHDRRILRAVLAMIITDAIILHSPIIIFDFGISSPHPHIWVMPMRVMEKIQVTWFSVQETIISGLYIWNTRSFLKDVYSRQTHRVMQLLITAQVMAFLFDITLITVDWENMFTLKIILHPFLYAIKLKMEFVVLNQLLALIKHGLAPSSFPAPDEESPDASGPTPPRITGGKHVSFLSSDKTATATGVKTDATSAPDVVERDMEYRHVSAAAAATHTDPDVILPTQIPPSFVSPSPVPRSPIPSPEVAETPDPVRPSSLPHSNFEPHLHARSFSDPTPLPTAQRDRDSDEIVAEIERHYLGRFGMDENT